MIALAHSFAFDPAYGHDLDSLLQINPSPEPLDYAGFWRQRYRRMLSFEPAPRISNADWNHPEYHVYDIEYRSSDDFVIGGWLTLPKSGGIRCGLVVGHGYGGRDGPEFDLPITGAAVLFPCFRGLSRSRRHGVSDNPAYHVLHDIDKPAQYILGGCVEDLWLAVSALLVLFPDLEGHLGYMGISFGGGIGAMALPWELRLQRAHLNVPSFGHQGLRLLLPTTGSGEAVRAFDRQHGNVMATLQYYDAALAARHVTVPVHVAAALFDPVVAPPGQFAIYNALGGPKELFVLDAGHFDYPGRNVQDRLLFASLAGFFASL